LLTAKLALQLPHEQKLLSNSNHHSRLFESISHVQVKLQIIGGYYGGPFWHFIFAPSPINQQYHNHVGLGHSAFILEYCGWKISNACWDIYSRHSLMAYSHSSYEQVACLFFAAVRRLVLLGTQYERKNCVEVLAFNSHAFDLRIGL